MFMSQIYTKFRISVRIEHLSKNRFMEWESLSISIYALRTTTSQCVIIISIKNLDGLSITVFNNKDIILISSLNKYKLRITQLKIKFVS